MKQKDDSYSVDSDILRARDIIPGQPKNGEVGKELSTKIPKFDLAGRIMAQQRKTVATRRKSPAQQASPAPDSRPAVKAAESADAPLAQQQKIIARIVARDIHKLCRQDAAEPKS